MKSLSLQECQQYLIPRPSNAHKGLFGHVLILGGDYGMEGSCRLAGEAALRSGAGLVSIATRKEHSFAISAVCPEIMAHAIETPEALDRLLEKATVIVVGPGLGLNPWGAALFNGLFQSDLTSALPFIVDADALNLLAKNPKKRENWILTPHPGEAARLLGKKTSEIQADRVAAVRQLQSQFGGVVVLKGAGTLVLGENSEPVICEAGNPGMASAGMGDTLSGVIGALVGQKLSLFEAASLGVIAHAVAGDKVAESGERGMKASDLLPEIRRCLNP